MPENLPTPNKSIKELENSKNNFENDICKNVNSF